MKKTIATAVLGVILSTSAVEAEAKKFRFEFLNEDGTAALGVGHGHFGTETTETITIQTDDSNNVQYSSDLRLTQIGITVNGKNGSARYVHTGKDVNDVAINDLYRNTWLNTNDQKGAGYSDGSTRTDEKWRFGEGDRNLTLNFEDRTWTQDTMESQAKGDNPVQVTSNGIFRLKMTANDANLPALDTLIDEPASVSGGGADINTPPLPTPSNSAPTAPVFTDDAIDIFDNTKVDGVVEEAKAAKSSKSGGGALGFLALLALPMAIRRRRSNA
jgi:hypothetical protein